MLKSAHCFSVENTSGLALVAVMALLFFGCPAPLKPPPAPPGAEPAPSMARIEPSAYPDFSDDLDFEGLEHGIRQSIVYLQSQPPGREFEFGRDRYTAAHLLLSLQRFQGFIRNRPSGAVLQKHIRTFYRVYQSAGRDQKGEVLFTLETEKVTYEVESPADGVLAKILIREGETVPVGAVVGYIAQAGVEQYDWLTTLQMMDGLGLAATPPGPLIMLVQFVGFLAGWNHPGSLGPLLGSVTGSLVATYFTFLPSFMFIFVGAPYIERLIGNTKMSAALATITPAVVGVVLNRLNVTLIAFNWQLPASQRYFPHWIEISLSVFIVTVGIVAFRFIVTRMPIFYEHPEYGESH